jgi:hypothetical protein
VDNRRWPSLFSLTKGNDETANRQNVAAHIGNHEASSSALFAAGIVKSLPVSPYRETALMTMQEERNSLELDEQ